MQYFFLEKQSPLTQRWKVRQIAFDPKYRYLYYSSPVSQSELEAAAQAAAIAELSGREEDVPQVTWRKKIKVKALDYMADDYAIPPTSPDFQEKMLLTMMVTGYERKLERPVKASKKRRSGKGKASGGGDYRCICSEDPLESTGRSNSDRFSGFGSNSVNAKGGYHHNATADTSGVSNNSKSAAEEDPPPPEPPSPVLHLEGYDVGLVAQQEEVEDAEENLFRDIELVPDSNPDDLDADDDDEDEEEEDEEDEDVVLQSPTTKALSEAASDERTSYYSFVSSRTASKTITVAFRARNYDAFRVVSLRLRQALVRHGLYQPLHAGLPPYDPRNGIAFATVPLHLRYQFRRLNEVVFYSFQHGHAVYVRHLREVRGLSGYLCITHDSVLLLQADGKCPRWVDLEDITGIDYVVKGSRSFVSILATAPMPDFLFIPIFPTYPLVSSFDAESAVEGVVGMLRRLLMQRLRADEDVSLAPLPKCEDLDADNASDVDDYDALCHIRDLTPRYDDVFQYISQNGAGRPLKWKWGNFKTPKHFTYKKDLAEVLQRDDEDDEEEESDDEDVEAPHREGALPAHRRSTPCRIVSDGRPLNSSMSSAASFTTATVAQLLAPPSEAAELRARERLRVTRTDPEKREMKRAYSPGGRAAPVTVAAVAAVAAGGTPSLPPGSSVPVPSAKPESYGLVHAPLSSGADLNGPDSPHLVPAAKGARLPANAPAVQRATSNPPLTPAATFATSSGKPTPTPKPPVAVTAKATAAAKSAFGVTNTKVVAPLKAGKGKAAHADPSKSGLNRHPPAMPPQVSSEDDDDEEDDDVFDSEDVDDLLEEPAFGAFQTPQHRKRNPNLTLRHRHRGEARCHSNDHSAPVSDDDSDYGAHPHPHNGEGHRPVSGPKAIPAGANSAHGALTHLYTPESPPYLLQQPPSMPTPTLQANTKLDTDFLVTLNAEIEAARPLEAALPPREGSS